MKTIDVEGLPEPVAQALEQVVRTLRVVLRPQPDGRRVELPRWPLKVLGRLSRKEICEDVG